LINETDNTIDGNTLLALQHTMPSNLYGQYLNENYFTLLNDIIDNFNFLKFKKLLFKLSGLDVIFLLPQYLQSTFFSQIIQLNLRTLNPLLPNSVMP